MYVYICGLNEMVSSVRTLLIDECGLEKKRVHYERYD
jgi:NADPH-dependent ferric siderophore reductase